MPKLPDVFTMGKNAAIAYIKWVDAGRPLRTPEEVEALFNYCAECPVKQFIKINDDQGRCASCGCHLRRGMKGLNKLKMPTEGCPHGLWHAQVKSADTDNETSPTAG